jgi:hypothetical protein
MVNSGLRGGRGRPWQGGKGLAGGQSVRIFATKPALTNQTVETGSPRSRFGPTDSWVIKIAGGNFCLGKLRDRANLGFISAFAESAFDE